MNMREKIEAAGAVLARIANVHNAIARAQTQRTEAAARAETVERDFARAQADHLVEGADGTTGQGDTLRKAAERARSDGRVATGALTELRLRLEREASELWQLKGELAAALSARVHAEIAALRVAARSALAPIGARLEEVAKFSIDASSASPLAYPLYTALAALASEDGMTPGARAAQPASAAEVKLLADAARWLEEIQRARDQAEETSRALRGIGAAT